MRVLPAAWSRLPGSVRLGARRGLQAVVLTAVAAGAWIAWPLPVDVTSPEPFHSVVLEDRHGLALRTTRADDGSRGGWIPYEDIDPDLIRAFLAAEDRRFFVHHGVDATAVARATWTNLRSGRVVSGASTLTMQTARLLRPIPRTWAGKARQALWALRLEAHLDKDRIFELYLNRLALGQGTRGVAAASALYFGASADDVSPGQAALLAALAHAPSRDNPLVDPARARRRRDEVLRRMAGVGYITPEEGDRARGEPVGAWSTA
ncbi:MAG TPA: biosynthetic peptidoglycan transglycosylase, partial [Longimicrobiales bacterium]|nr:biosynthetic peptidoglycan transglycosylase [Longimicrobiales bacterium]